MKKVLTSIGLFLVSTAVMASTANVKFKPLDQSLESKVCVVAAQNGFHAAKAQLKKTFDNYIEVMSVIECNGQKLRAFAESYQPAKQTVKQVATVKKSILVKPADDTTESKICAAAVNKGLKAVAGQVRYDVKEVICNGVGISRFVNRHSTI